MLSNTRKDLFFPFSKLYVIIDYDFFGEDFKKVAEKVIEAGVLILQFRAKKLSDRDFLEKALFLRDLTRVKDALFIINDRVDVASAIEADGVHLGQDDLPVAYARKIIGNKIIGQSVHDLEEALRAEEEGANYICLGPIFPTQTKDDVRKILGVELIAKVKSAINIPLYVIGGLNERNLKKAIEAGADGVSVISAISKKSPLFSAKKLLSAIDDAQKDKIN